MQHLRRLARAALFIARLLTTFAAAAWRPTKPVQFVMLPSQGAFSIFWANSLVAGITSLALPMLVWPLFGKLRGRGSRAEAAA